MEVHFWNGRSFRENRNFARGMSSNRNLEFWGLTGTISKGNIEIQKKFKGLKTDAQVFLKLEPRTIQQLRRLF